MSARISVLPISRTGPRIDPDVRPVRVRAGARVHLHRSPPRSQGSDQHALNALIEDRLALLASLHFTVPKREKLSMKELNAINAQIQQRIQNQDPAAFSAASLYAELMKLRSMRSPLPNRREARS